VAKQGFESLKNELEDAYLTLRGFTLGHSGFNTQKCGTIAIQNVTELCDRLVTLFKVGPYAARAAALAASGRTRVVAAQFRMEVLRSKGPSRQSQAK
jgi:hypothetical protein